MTEALAGRRVVVAGGRVAGAAAVQALLARAAEVTVIDAAPLPGLDALTAAGARVLVGDVALPAGSELLVVSPGFRPDHPLPAAATRAGVPVWGDAELAWRLRPAGAAPWLALTGTNGKTTTVQMLTEMLRAGGHRAVAAGNVGLPLVEAVLAGSPPGSAYDVLAVELSSFQLHWSASLRPAAAAVLNLAPDHVDWHGSLAAYAAAKGRLFAADPVAVFNRDDEAAAELVAHCRRRVGFTIGPPSEGVLGLRDGWLVDAGGCALAAVADIPLPGAHNVANALAAAGLARVYDVPPDAVRAGLRAFVPGAHRNTVVATIDGVAWVDDSKATNPHAAAASLSAYPRVVWVAGGLLKGADVDELVRMHAARLRAAVLIGRDRARICDAIRRHAPDLPVVEVAADQTGRAMAVMSEVAAAARRLARPGDTVLLAPAAASMDLFTSYAERGSAFAAAARALPGRR